MVSYGQEAFDTTQQPHLAPTEGCPEQQMWLSGAEFGKALGACGEQKILSLSRQSASFST